MLRGNSLPWSRGLDLAPSPVPIVQALVQLGSEERLTRLLDSRVLAFHTGHSLTLMPRPLFALRRWRDDPKLAKHIAATLGETDKSNMAECVREAVTAP